MIESLEGDDRPADEGSETSPEVDGERITRGTSRTRGGESDVEPTGAESEKGDDSSEEEDGSDDGERITRGTSRTRG
ncbi:MAG: hypothetical protein AAGD33_14920 [Actinomycetota bacterium]